MVSASHSPTTHLVDTRTDIRVDTDSSDEDLMSAYALDQAAAFDILYDRHKGPLYRFMCRQSGCPPAEAEEMFQDVWMKLIHARRTYTVQAKFTTWLYRIAHNRLIDYYRQQGRIFAVGMPTDETSTEDPPDATGAQPDRRLANQQTLQRLMTTLERLPTEQREAFLLQREGGLSLQAIAEITGSKHETVKSRLRYAVNRLRQALDEDAA